MPKGKLCTRVKAIGSSFEVDKSVKMGKRGALPLDLFADKLLVGQFLAQLFSSPVRLDVFKKIPTVVRQQPYCLTILGGV
jgi:hypothetical protein